MTKPAGQRRQIPLNLHDPRQSERKRQGLSPLEVRALYASQGGRCAICGAPFGTRHVVDHDHHLAAAHGHGPKAGCPACVRGLLCYACNKGLGLFERHGSDVLARAAVYAERRRSRAAS